MVKLHDHHLVIEKSFVIILSWRKSFMITLPRCHVTVKQLQDHLWHSFLNLHLLASSSWGCPLWQSFSYLQVGPVTTVERAIEFYFILFFRGLFWISHSPSRVGRVWNSCGFSGWAAGVPGCLSMFLLVDFVAPGVFLLLVLVTFPFVEFCSFRVSLL